KLIGRNQINALAGFMDETFRADFVSAYRVGFLGTDLEELAVGNLDGQTGTSNAKKNILRSWFGRLNYAFDGKYLLEGNIRHDGTSRFTGANRWSTFPSFSAGWRISQEGFFQNSNLAQHITELKLRGGGVSWVTKLYLPLAKILTLLATPTILPLKYSPLDTIIHSTRSEERRVGNTRT